MGDSVASVASVLSVVRVENESKSATRGSRADEGVRPTSLQSFCRDHLIAARAERPIGNRPQVGNLPHIGLEHSSRRVQN